MVASFPPPAHRGRDLGHPVPATPAGRVQPRSLTLGVTLGGGVWRASSRCVIRATGEVATR